MQSSLAQLPLRLRKQALVRSHSSQAEMSPPWAGITSQWTRSSCYLGPRVSIRSAVFHAYHLCIVVAQVAGQ